MDVCVWGVYRMSIVLMTVTREVSGDNYKTIKGQRLCSFLPIN